MGGYKYRVFLRKRPGLQNGVRLQGVSAYKGCPLGGVRLYFNSMDNLLTLTPVTHCLSLFVKGAQSRLNGLKSSVLLFVIVPRITRSD